MEKLEKPIVKVQGLTKGYGHRPVLKNLSASIEPGKITGLLGPNGQGKSTFIKLITGLLKPDGGTIEILGKAPGPSSKKIVSYLPERSMLDLSWNVKQAVDFYRDFYEDFDLAKAKRLLNSLNLEEGMKIKEMSKGMQEKLQLVLVMSRKARLYVLDEPLGGVDPASRDYILNTILQNFDEGASMIISTHLISDVERILDNVLFLKNGEIILSEEADALRQKHQSSIDAVFRKEFACH